MRRREFLTRSAGIARVALFAPALVSVVGLSPMGCGEDEDPIPTGGSGNPDSTTYSVDLAAGHTHSFSIPNATLANPPAAGFTADTSSVSGHRHRITLSQAELMDIQAATAVSGSTSFVAGHLHGFTFP